MSMQLIDILPALKNGDTCSQTAMPRRENVLCGVYVAIMNGSALTTSPVSYYKGLLYLSDCLRANTHSTKKLEWNMIR